MTPRGYLVTPVRSTKNKNDKTRGQYTAEAFIEKIHNEPRHGRKQARTWTFTHLTPFTPSSDHKFRRGQSLPGPYLLRISDRQIDRSAAIASDEERSFEDQETKYKQWERAAATITRSILFSRQIREGGPVQSSPVSSDPLTTLSRPFMGNRASDSFRGYSERRKI